MVAISGGAILPQLALKILGFYFRPSAHQVAQMYERRQSIKKMEAKHPHKKKKKHKGGAEDAEGAEGAEDGAEVEGELSLVQSFRYGVSHSSSSKKLRAKSNKRLDKLIHGKSKKKLPVTAVPYSADTSAGAPASVEPPADSAAGAVPPSAQPPPTLREASEEAVWSPKGMAAAPAFPQAASSAAASSGAGAASSVDNAAEMPRRFGAFATPPATAHA